MPPHGCFDLQILPLKSVWEEAKIVCLENEEKKRQERSVWVEGGGNKGRARWKKKKEKQHNVVKWLYLAFFNVGSSVLFHTQLRAQADNGLRKQV